MQGGCIMGKMNLDILHNRKGTDCVKWDHKDFVDSRVSDSALPLWLSDMEFKVADEITDALIKRWLSWAFYAWRQLFSICTRLVQKAF